MARGFGATLGAGITDNIALSLATTSTQRSWSIWLNRNENETMRCWAKEDAAGNVYQEVLYYYATTGKLSFYRHWTTSGIWNFTAPAVDEWHHLLVTYDSGSTSNDPVMYLDGVSQSIAESNTPSGSLVNCSEGFMLGNFRANTSNGIHWRGSLAEFAVWDTILNAAEAKALGTWRCSPLAIRPASRVHCSPVWGAHSPEFNYHGAGGTVTGTAKQPHPPTFNPGGRVFSVQTQASEYTGGWLRYRRP